MSEQIAQLPEQPTEIQVVHTLTNDQQFELWKILNKQFNPPFGETLGMTFAPELIADCPLLKAERELYTTLTKRYYCDLCIVRITEETTELKSAQEVEKL